MSFELRWLGTACFQMILPGDVHIVTDPYMDDSINSPITSDQIEGCDYIFLTHGHFDHVLDVGKLAERFAPPIYCNQTTAAALLEHQGVKEGLLNRLRAADAVELPGFKIEVLPGVHTQVAAEFERLLGRKMPAPEDFDDPVERLKTIIKAMNGTDQIPDQYPTWRKMYTGGEQLNFVFEGNDGQRIYMAGSYPDPRVRATAKKVRATVTLLQCMSANKMRGIEQETADVAIASGCKTVIPQHHDPIYKGACKTDLSKLKRILTEQSDIAFLEMTPGLWYTFENGIAQR